jgi:hypothetical protein
MPMFSGKHYANPAVGRMMEKGVEKKGESPVKSPSERKGPGLPHESEEHDGKIVIAKHKDGHFSTEHHHPGGGAPETVHHDSFKEAMNHVHGSFGEQGTQDQVKDDNSGYSNEDNMESLDGALGGGE